MCAFLHGAASIDIHEPCPNTSARLIQR